MKRYISGTICICLLIIFVYVHVSNSLAPYTLSDHIVADSFQKFQIIKEIDLDLTHEHLWKRTVSLKVPKRLPLRKLIEKLTRLNKLLEEFNTRKTNSYKQRIFCFVKNETSIVTHYWLGPNFTLKLANDNDQEFVSIKHNRTRFPKRGVQQDTSFTHNIGKGQHVCLEGNVVVNFEYTKNQEGFPIHLYVVVTHEAYKILRKIDFKGIDYVTTDGIRWSIISESQSVPEEVMQEFAASETGFNFKPVKVRLKRLDGLRDIFRFILRITNIQESSWYAKRDDFHPRYNIWLKTFKIGETDISFAYWKALKAAKGERIYEGNMDFFEIGIKDA